MLATSPLSPRDMLLQLLPLIIAAMRADGALRWIARDQLEHSVALSHARATAVKAAAALASSEQGADGGGSGGSTGQDQAQETMTIDAVVKANNAALISFCAWFTACEAAREAAAAAAARAAAEEAAATIVAAGVAAAAAAEEAAAAIVAADVAAAAIVAAEVAAAAAAAKAAAPIVAAGEAAAAKASAGTASGSIDLEMTTAKSSTIASSSSTASINTTAAAPTAVTLQSSSNSSSSNAPAPAKRRRTTAPPLYTLEQILAMGPNVAGRPQLGARCVRDPALALSFLGDDCPFRTMFLPVKERDAFSAHANIIVAACSPSLEAAQPSPKLYTALLGLRDLVEARMAKKPLAEGLEDVSKAEVLTAIWAA